MSDKGECERKGERERKRYHGIRQDEREKKREGEREREGKSARAREREREGADRVTNWFHCSANESNNSRPVESYRVRAELRAAEGVVVASRRAPTHRVLATVTVVGRARTGRTRGDGGQLCGRIMLRIDHPRLPINETRPVTPCARRRVGCVLTRSGRCDAESASARPGDARIKDASGW